SYCTAKTVYGILGIKVWVFKGEIIPGQEPDPLPPASRDRERDPRDRDREPRRRQQQRRRQQFEDRSNEG
ncbi:30S ribosomal protein S3, partial [Nostoc cf. edaphicum LEGE 07299]|nr:30S ribosomal protein S3 [Nostoc cf. edaphicum LEGE 07299]